MNGFSKACLVMIILLLGVTAMRPIVSPQPALAASHHYQYLVVTTLNASASQIQTELDKRAAEGWELDTAGWSQTTPGVSDLTLIFRKKHADSTCRDHARRFSDVASRFWLCKQPLRRACSRNGSTVPRAVVFKGVARATRTTKDTTADIAVTF